MRRPLLLLVLAIASLLALIALHGTPVRGVVPCTTDSDCHAKNPGLCRADEPYCF